MSTAGSCVRCHGCDFEGFMPRRPIVLEYKLPSGVRVEGHYAFAWCTSCDKITEAEEKLDVPAIQAELQALTPTKSGIFGRLLSGSKADQSEIAQLQGKLKLAQIRQSPPRCLRCGKPTAVPIKFDQDGNSDVVHTCGRRLYMAPDDPDAPRFMYRTEVIPLDSEGRKI